MRDMVEDAFDDIGEAITNSETDVYLDARQCGGRRRRNKRFEMEGVHDYDDVDAGVEVVKDRESSRSNNKIPTTTVTRAGFIQSQRALLSLALKSSSRRN